MVRLEFADEKIKRAFERLKDNNLDLYRFLLRAFSDIKNDPGCGIPIRKKLIPKEYIKKYAINNLFKYNLPNAWRLLYSLTGSKIEIIAIILEWLDHKSYERKFKY